MLLQLYQLFFHSLGQGSVQVLRTHVEMLLHDKTTCVHWYGLFIVRRPNNNSVPCWKYCSYMDEPSPRFPLPACLLHSQWLVVCSAAINSFRIIRMKISIIVLC